MRATSRDENDLLSERLSTPLKMNLPSETTEIHTFSSAASSSRTCDGAGVADAAICGSSIAFVGMGWVAGARPGWLSKGFAAGAVPDGVCRMFITDCNETLAEPLGFATLCSRHSNTPDEAASTATSEIVGINQRVPVR